MTKFATFFTENYSLVVSVAEHRLGSLHDAEEIATEAFRVAWEHFKAGEQISVPWLYGVVRNLIGNEYRSRTRRGALQDRMREEFPRSAHAVDASYSEIRDAVDRLPPEHREILVMTYWEELTAPEAAAVLAVSATAVRTRLMRARRALKAVLNETTTQATGEVKTHE